MVVNVNHMPLAIVSTAATSREQGLRQTLVYQTLKCRPAFKRKPLKYIKYPMYRGKHLVIYELRIKIVVVLGCQLSVQTSERSDTRKVEAV